ncbi:MAG: EAL domain-containing protein [Pseudohongiellaceae bacterium]
MSSGRITSVENLPRWQHKDRGLLGPGAFIPLTEQQALINPLTFAIYRKAVQQISSWHSAGLSLSASINFSINTFMLDKLPDFLQDIAQEYAVSPHNIIVEITETQIMKKAASCLEVFMRLRLKKFKLSIDDFDTDTSSMTQLKAIPFNELKIDKAFVKSAQSNSSAMAILETSVELARRLGMTIVAKGAETLSEWNLCRSLGVDYIQGFYCAKAMTSEDLIPSVLEWNRQAG